jgi:hypothetical protein
MLLQLIPPAVEAIPNSDAGGESSALIQEGRYPVWSPEMDQWSFFSNTLAQVLGGVMLASLAAGGAALRNRWPHSRSRVKPKGSADRRVLEEGKQPEVLAAAAELKVRGLEAKLDELAKGSELRTILVGGLYVDIMVRPVKAGLLKAEEWSDLDPIEMQLGGSCYWLGRNLHQLYGQQSYLYTLLGGSDDALTADSARLVEREGWVLNLPPRGSGSSRTAISILLIQRNNRQSTIFTYRGVLAEMSWRHLRGDLVQNLQVPSLIHISGFLKTNLSSGFLDFLRPLHARHLICLDHGGFVSQVESPPAISAIREAYEQGVVDIYLCTLEEFQQFCEFPAEPTKKVYKGSTEQLIRMLARTQCLPCVTVVRGEDLPDWRKVYIVIKEEVTVVTLRSPRTIAKGLVFSKMMFDAAFLYSLTHSHAGSSLEARTAAAADEGLISWAEAAQPSQ